MKVTIDEDNVSDGLSIPITLELHAEDHTVDTPKIEFSVNKILGERFSMIHLMIFKITIVSFYSLG